jgi:hypothetical protein
MVVIALSVILALVVAIRIASGKQTRNLADHLSAEWWKWALQDPALEKVVRQAGPNAKKSL